MPEDDPNNYEYTGQGHLPWYQGVPTSFVAADDAAAMVSSFKADFQARGDQIKASLGSRATIGQIAAALRQEAHVRLQQSAAAVAPH